MLTAKRYYTTRDVIEEVGISRLTLYRWFASGKIMEVPKDYKQHRIFTKKEILAIKRFKEKIRKPATRKGTDRKWSPQFLNLPGTWQDHRKTGEILSDIYGFRAVENRASAGFDE